MTRAEFTEAIVLAAGEVPKDPLLVESKNHEKRLPIPKKR